MLGKSIFFMIKVIIFVSFGAFSPEQSAVSATDKSIIDNSDLSLLEISSDGIVLEFRPPQDKKGVLEAELYDLDNHLLAKVSRRHEGKPLQVELFAQINKEDPANYYLRYRFDGRQEFRRRSLAFATEVLETIVTGQKEFLAGTQPQIRILVRDRSAGIPIHGATVSVELTKEEKVISKFTWRTDANGEVAATLDMPDEPMDNARLKVIVTTRSATDTVMETIRVRSALRTLLTTDKPLYQPGQTIHIRSLTLSQPDMKPLSDASMIFEVEDSKGNKVFKVSRTTDSYGISSADFILADELNLGSYRIRAIAAGSKEEKTVTVDKYVLPKFKIDLKTDRNFYQPGETVKGDIQADYFFGKSVAGGTIQIKCSKFDVAYEEFQVVEGKTDQNGHYTFDIRLPEHFVGQPLEAGKASAKFEISLVDTADHKETITRNVSVTASPILIAAVPEGGDLIQNLPNKIYIVTTYADATPASCTIRWTNPAKGNPVTLQTDAAGFGEITFESGAELPTEVSLTAKDAKGQTGKASISLQTRPTSGDDSILLRSDKGLYKVADSVLLSILSTRKTGTVYVDIIKDRQTYLTRSLELKDGRTSDKITLDQALAGTVQINAYIIGKSGVITRDQRLILVDPANDLKIDVSSNEESYLPGAKAKLQFKVTNNRGKGIASALGIMVVDEAVFALQEMQPGLEKVYFYLEKEIATPRYEIHGYELDHCIGGPVPLADSPEPLALQNNAARVLLASAKGTGDYSLNVNTFERDNKANLLQQKMADRLMPKFQKIQEALSKFSEKHRKPLQKRFQAAIDPRQLVKEGFLTEEDTKDFWDGTFKISGTWCVNCQSFHEYSVLSAGIDGIWDTIDDIAMPGNANRERMMGRDLRFAIGMAEKAMPAVAAPMAIEMQKEAKADAIGGLSNSGSAPNQAEPIRIREYFPETLYFQPALITDGSGKANLDIPLADSITTWRLTCMASSAMGQLGSTTAGIRVFQDFFVDVDFPVALTQNDQVHVPVAIYNYLKTDQQIRLQVQKEDWFELEGVSEKTVTLAASEVRAVYFPITARKIGVQKFTVTARGSSKSDAVARTVEILPDGKEFLVSQSGRLAETVNHTITIPDNALDDASKIFVKVYPGILSQVVEGLDKMLRMPFGCFEQTSSVTYPNILVMDYMKTTGKITPELQMKAEGFINAGYQRLVSYEVPGGGFEWFGKAPAHRILTAYGLMEFFDMAKVYEVDPAIITRTQKWLAKCQDKDGSYKPSEGGIQEGAVNKFTDDVLRNTAYITWALASTEYKGPEIGNGIGYLRNHLDNMKDVYTRVLVVNALATVAPDDKTTLDTLRTLHDMRIEKDDMVYWETKTETPTCGTGKAADVEVTALAIQAFLRCGREPGTVSKAITYLVKNKDAFGTWQSTQATIQALRAMLTAERGAVPKVRATIDVICNDKQTHRLTVDENNSEVLQLVDLQEQTRKGNNSISLTFNGEGGLMYQIVGRYYLPYEGKVRPSQKEPMTIRVEYDRTKLAANDILGVSATVINNRPGKAKMVMVDLGLPPGFTLIPDQLNRAVELETIEKYSTTGRQIMIYLREVENGKPVKIQYQLMAKYPLRAKTPKSATYEYYNPEIRAETQPVELVVNGGQSD